MTVDVENMAGVSNGDKRPPTEEQDGSDVVNKRQKVTEGSEGTRGTSPDGQSLAKTRAFGKLILFGEHFVVYQVPALVGAVAAYTDCAMELLEDSNNHDKEDEAGKPKEKKNFLVVDQRPAVPNYKAQKAAEGEKAIELVLNHFKLSNRKMKLTFGGDLCCVSGIGASAAQCVSLARAVAQTIPAFSQLTDEEINAAGYEGERGYHGTPSGIDNTAATFGGLLRFQRTEGDPIFIKKQLKQPIRIVYASTGITASTSEVVGDVRAKKDADENWFKELLEKYVALVPKAEQAMEEGDMKLLGDLLNENHTLCQSLTVSCKELDDLVDAARTAGAYGAKMSGTGRGGLMLALTPTKELQEAVAAALETAGAPQVWKTSFC